MLIRNAKPVPSEGPLPQEPSRKTILSASQLPRAAQIRREIERLRKELARVLTPKP